MLSLIHVTCLRCHRRFELDPIWVGVELRKLKTRSPKHYQAHCPGCQAVNKVSVNEMRRDLDAASDEIEAVLNRPPADEENSSSSPS
jgi:hypothetical protein